ncbi:MAG: SDR family oxidoreductase [Myxococcales bacterium]|nr:SDR family oxidoreductase [Myxococcales bacterium]
MARLEGKVAFITGAASGIGAACAKRFAKEGAVLAGFDRDEPVGGSGDDWKAAVELAPGSNLQTGDVRDDEALGAAVDAAKHAHGRIDILVNSAGVGSGGPVHLIEIEEWDRCIDINLKGTFLASRRILPIMLEQGSGSIIHLASVEGIEGFEGGSAYNASKGAVILLMRNMAIDYGRKGIRVNAICPGFIDTPLMNSVMGMPGLEAVRSRIEDAHQLGRFGRAEEIANAALFLASDEASFVTGHALVVDGGYTAGHRFGIGKLMGLDSD